MRARIRELLQRISRAEAGGFLRSHDAGRLADQIRWFNNLRYGAVLGMALLGVLGWYGALIDDVRPIAGLAGASLAINVVYVQWLRRRRTREPLALRRHVDLQIGLDLVVLALLLYWSGGVSNPLVVSVLFHTLIAALLLSLRAAIFVAASSFALVIGLAILVREGRLPHHRLHGALFDPRTVDPLVLVGWLATLALLLALAILIVAAVVRQLAGRDAELQGLTSQLARSEKLASIGTLAAGVSHEINNPVGVIRSKVGVLRYRIEDGDEKELLLAELDAIDKHARRIGTITEGLLTFSREGPFELVPVRVNELLPEAADLVRVPYKSAEIGLEVRLAPGDPRIGGSANHLLQVLVNLLLNARDASRAGTRVTLAAEVSADACEVALEVSDEGEGIPPENLGKIFDPFFTTKGVGRGTGLGLALSHGIVERHRGRRTVESEVGRGSRFRVILPALEMGTVGAPASTLSP